MEVINLYEDPGLLNDFKEYDLLVTSYKTFSYEGYGEAWAFKKGNNNEPDLFYKWYLGHCSCYGPYERAKPSKFTVDEATQLLPGEMRKYFTNLILKSNLNKYERENKILDGQL